MVSHLSIDERCWDFYEAYCNFFPSLVTCSSIDDLDTFIERNCVKLCVGGGNNWMCNLCQYNCKSRKDIKKHIEAKHVNLPKLMCTICNKSYKTREVLRKHELQFHKDNLA